MIVDTSAVVAVLHDEPDAASFALTIAECGRPGISAASLLEASLVLGSRRQTHLDDFLRESDFEVVPFDREHLRAARRAHIRYGRASGSRARLNFGDCFSYALAMSRDEPLLFKGDDFTHTDVRPAL